jgi:hypothetical protein
MDGARGINTYGKLPADDNVLAVAKVIANDRGSSYLQPDAIIMHPSNWLSCRILRDGAVRSWASISAVARSPVRMETVAPPTGTCSALNCGTRRSCSTRPSESALHWSDPSSKAPGSCARGGPTIEVSNSHGSYFVQNLAMTRCEERLALCVFRPSAFMGVTRLT